MKYTYWLSTNKIGDTFHKQILELEKYKNKYNAEIFFYVRNLSIFDNIISLKCEQNYYDLDLDVNSMSDVSFIRLKQKPKNIMESRLQLDYYLSEINNINEKGEI